MKLDLSSLAQAIDSLAEALDVLQGAVEPSSPPVRRVLVAGVIQNFEFTYELAHKMLKRHLEAISPSSLRLDEQSFPDLIRLGSEAGLLLHGWDVWKTYRQARNATSHTYNQAKAQEVLAQVPAFLAEAQALLAKLQERQGHAT